MQIPVKSCYVLPMKTTILYQDIQEDEDTRVEMFRLSYEDDNAVPRYPGGCDTREEMFHLSYEDDNTVPRDQGGCRFP